MWLELVITHEVSMICWMSFRILSKKFNYYILLGNRVFPWGLYQFPEVNFDFDFDPLVSRKTVWKASSKRKVTNLSDKFRAPITKMRYMSDLTKVTRGFGYFLLILLHRSLLQLEFNSASNSHNFLGDRLRKIWRFAPKYCFCHLLLVCVAYVGTSICGGSLVSLVGCRIKFCIECSSFSEVYS